MANLHNAALIRQTNGSTPGQVGSPSTPTGCNRCRLESGVHVCLHILLLCWVWCTRRHRGGYSNFPRRDSSGNNAERSPQPHMYLVHHYRTTSCRLQSSYPPTAAFYVHRTASYFSAGYPTECPGLSTGTLEWFVFVAIIKFLCTDCREPAANAPSHIRRNSCGRQ